MSAVLGHHNRLRLGKIKDLTGVVIAVPGVWGNDSAQFVQFAGR